MSLLDDLINIDLSNLTEKVIAEYVWIGGSGMDLRSKSRILHTPVTDDPHKLPKWNFDGSSTGQAAGKDSEIILYPQAIFKDPFRRDRNILVMCDTYTPTGDPIPTNKRYNAAGKIFSNPDVVAQQPWFGIDQQYTLLQKGTKWPIGLPAGVYPDPQGPFYCGVGSGKSFGRDIANAHYIACLYAGLNIGGISGEVAPGQWEFQVGPVTGVSAGDELWIARYILERITEITGVLVSFEPVLLHGDCYTSRTNVKYSTKSIREDEGYECIRKAIEKLGLRQEETHIDVYGEGNEIANFENRGDSFRIGRGTEMAGKGYLEDRRAASNMDPYVVTSMIAETTIIWKAM